MIRALFRGAKSFTDIESSSPVDYFLVPEIRNSILVRKERTHEA